MAESLDYLNTALGALTAAKNYQQQQKAYDQSVKAFDWSKEMDRAQLQFAQNQFTESIRQYEQNYAQAERAVQQSQANYMNEAQIRTNDLMKAGLNPMMYTGSGAMQLSPVQSTSVAGNFSGASGRGTFSAPQIDLSALSSLFSQLREMKHDASERAKDRALEREKLAESRRQTNLFAANERYKVDIEDASREQSNFIRQKELDAAISRDLMNAENASKLLNETYRHNKEQEYLTRIGLTNEQKKLVLQQAKQDDEYRIAVQKLEQEKKALENAKDKADRDRRMQYVTRLTQTIFSGLSRVASALFGRSGGGDDSATNPIGFFAN